MSRERSTDGDRAMVHLLPLTPESVTAMCTLARALDLDCVRIDLAGCTDKSDCLARIARSLEFPSWFGQNWDALFDCLADLGWRPAAGYVLVLEHTRDLRERAPEVFDATVAVLGDAASVWRERGRPFQVFVDGPPLTGPGIGVCC